MNYDLEILHNYVKVHGSQKVVVTFQDTEAFDSGLLAELVILFRQVDAVTVSKNHYIDFA